MRVRVTHERPLDLARVQFTPVHFEYLDHILQGYQLSVGRLRNLFVVRVCGQGLVLAGVVDVAEHQKDVRNLLFKRLSLVGIGIRSVSHYGIQP